MSLNIYVLAKFRMVFRPNRFMNNNMNEQIRVHIAKCAFPI